MWTAKSGNSVATDIKTEKQEVSYSICHGCEDLVWEVDGCPCDYPPTLLFCHNVFRVCFEVRNEGDGTLVIAELPVACPKGKGRELTEKMKESNRNIINYLDYKEKDRLFKEMPDIHVDSLEPSLRVEAELAVRRYMGNQVDEAYAKWKRESA